MQTAESILSALSQPVLVSGSCSGRPPADSRALRQGTKWRGGEMPPCRGGRALLREVASNLPGNAFKFTRGRAEARITVGCAASGTETVYFVRDNGAGFDMNRADSLFAPHRQDEFEGAGVGLALVKRIIERRNGRIWAEAAVDRGQRFISPWARGKRP